MLPVVVAGTLPSVAGESLILPVDVTEVAELLADVLADAEDRPGLAEEGVENAASSSDGLVPEEGVDGIVSSAGFFDRRLHAALDDGVADVDAEAVESIVSSEDSLCCVPVVMRCWSLCLSPGACPAICPCTSACLRSDVAAMRCVIHMAAMSLQWTCVTVAPARTVRKDLVIGQTRGP